MMNYNIREIRTAILKVVPIGTIISKENVQDIKWLLILNDGFDHKGWLNENDILVAMGMMRNDEHFERHRNAQTQKRFFVRIA
jgi:hypothetical protein